MPTDRFSSWPEEYARKIMEPDEAARLVRSGDCVVIPIGSITPNLSSALFNRRDELRDIDLLTCAPYVDPGWFEPGHPTFRTHIEIFNTIIARQSHNSGRSDFLSIPFSRRFKATDERGASHLNPDVTLISVSPPDRFGFCSFGTSMWNKASYARRARTVLAEMYGSYPHTGGANKIHVTEIDAFVDGGEPPPLPRRPAPPFPPAIAHYVNELVNDGDTIQIGTGAMTAQLAVGGAFEGKRELGMHTEISVPGLNDLVLRGVITGERKNRHTGKFVATALSATTPEEVQFIHENPVYEVYDVEYTNDIQVIASHDNMVAINNALTVDLTGQIASESIGTDLWSGPGGQLEFAIGALLSRGGRSVTVLPSSSREGEVSRIVAQHPPGTVVTVPRQFADYVVTEHGIARLYGKTDRERAKELIAVAHPDHRKKLRRQLERGSLPIPMDEAEMV
jgi:4-hydroxybutyrate CoA-transferase